LHKYKALHLVQNTWGHACDSQNVGLSQDDKGGKIKKGFGKGQRGSMASNKKTANAFSQLVAKIVKLKKANEKLKKSSQKSTHNIAATVMTPTPLEGAGPIAHRGATVENLN